MSDLPVIHAVGEGQEATPLSFGVALSSQPASKLISLLIQLTID